MGELLTTEELAERLKIKPATVRVWARDGLIPEIRITPKAVRYDLADVVTSLRQADRRQTADREAPPCRQ